MSSQNLSDSKSSDVVTPHTPETVSQKPVFWWQIFALLIVGVSIGVLPWAVMARDKTISVKGKLEQGTLKEIKAPTGGAVQEIYVKDGDVVQADQLLATFQPTAPKADLESLKKEKEALTRQNQLYQDVLQGSNPANGSDSAPLAQLRAEFVQENKYYQALVTGKNPEGGASGNVNANQQRILAASSPESQARATAWLKIQELEKQLIQVQEKVAATQKLLAVNKDYLQKLQQLAVPQPQYIRQNQEVLINQTDIGRLREEQQQLATSIGKAREELQNAMVFSGKDVLIKITQNQKRIDQIDLQLKQTQQENQKRIAEIDAELLKAAQVPQPQQLKAPVAGVVFNLKLIAPKNVAKANQTLLTIVPNNNWMASVFLRVQDIASVKQKMAEDVRVACFPANNSSIEGKLVTIGSAALPPVAERPYYAIPANVQLNNLEASGKLANLQPGMLVNCQIKLPQQTVLDVVRHKFDQKFKSFDN